MVPSLYRNGASLPAHPANRLSTLFDRFFNDDFFGAPVSAWRSVPLSLWQDEQNIYVEMDAPGLTDKDIELSIEQGDLLIKGERKCERREGAYDTRCYGQFQQRITLPAAVDGQKVEAKLANGVLAVTCPKSEAAKPRRISVKSE